MGRSCLEARYAAQPPRRPAPVRHAQFSFPQDYFHSNSLSAVLPFSSTSCSNTQAILLSPAKRCDEVWYRIDPRQLAAVPFPVGLPTPVPVQVTTSPSFVMITPCPTPLKTPDGVRTDS